MKVCSKQVWEASWVDFVCFYAFLWRSTWPLNGFFLLLLTFFFTFFVPFSTLSGVIFRSKWNQNGVILGWFRTILCHFGVTLGSFWGCVSIVFGIIFEPFWCIFDAFGRLWAFLGQKRVIFGGFASKKVHWDLKTPFWKGHLELSIREGTRSNGHE